MEVSVRYKENIQQKKSDCRIHSSSATTDEITMTSTILLQSSAA
jgi:hypothetical protein